MPKQLQNNKEIYLAVDILGKYQDGEPVAIDERNGNTKLDPRKIDDKIIIYEREVKEWFLDRASELIKQNDSNYNFKNGFIILIICMAYFESIEQYKTGVSSNSRSKEFFRDSIKRLYPQQFQNPKIDELYAKCRCGLFHNSMVKGGVTFSYAFDKAIKFSKNGDIEINPQRLLEDIKHDFDKYLDELKNKNNRIARENFNRMFNVLQD